MTTLSLPALVAGAAAGDDRAWTQLVVRFDRQLRNIARSYRLDTADVDDAVQMTWVRVFTRIGALRDPEAIGAWLMTTLRRECLRLLQSHVREVLTADPEFGDCLSEGPETDCLMRERQETLGRALHSLPDRQRRLMVLFAQDAEPNYREISRELNMPLGSIGPSRARGIERLRANPALQALAG